MNSILMVDLKNERKGLEMNQYAWGLVERNGAQVGEQVQMARSIQPSQCPIKLVPSRIESRSSEK